MGAESGVAVGPSAPARRDYGRFGGVFAPQRPENLDSNQTRFCLHLELAAATTQVTTRHEYLDVRSAMSIDAAIGSRPHPCSSRASAPDVLAPSPVPPYGGKDARVRPFRDQSMGINAVGMRATPSRGLSLCGSCSSQTRLALPGARVLITSVHHLSDQCVVWFTGAHARASSVTQRRGRERRGVSGLVRS